MQALMYFLIWGALNVMMMLFGYGAHSRRDKSGKPDNFCAART
jgi:hypothetical protein